MSRTETTDPILDSDRPGENSPAAAPSKRWNVWAWTAVACVTLGASGVVRAVQERRHRDETNFRESCPISLASIPAKLGGWRLVEGGEKSLDELTVRITGGTDYILRNYVDDLTGVSLVALILFGPAEPVLPHTPEVCYPSTGYALSDDASDRLIKADDGTAAEFRSLVYAKPGGRMMLREEVYYSFRLEGHWSPSAGLGRKFPRRNPSVFKVQVQRRVAEGEHRDRDEPIEQFLKILIPEIERRLAEADKPATSTVKTSMGGPGSGPVVGEGGPGPMIPRPGPGLAGLTANRLGGGSSGDPRGPLGQDRHPSDQADEQGHGQQIDGQRHADRGPDRVETNGPASFNLLVGSKGTFRDEGHHPRS